MKKLAIIALVMATAFTGAVPAQAFPRLDVVKTSTAANPDVVNVRDHRRDWRRYDRRDYRDRRHYRDGYYRSHRRSNAGAIIGGLAAGAIIGGIISPQNRTYYGGGNSHVRSCYARYRSYRASDNTYQPYYGPRRQCR